MGGIFFIIKYSRWKNIFPPENHPHKKKKKQQLCVA